MLGEVAAGDVADLLDPQPVQHPAERLALGRLDRGDELLGRHLAKSRLLGDLLGLEPVEVAGGLDPAELHEQADLLLAEPVDVHRADEMREQLPAAAGADRFGHFVNTESSGLTVGV